MAPKRKRIPKKELSSKKQKSVVVKQNVRQNANPTIHINFASSRQKPRAKQRSPALQTRQQQQQPNPSQVNVAPVINISLADVLSNQRTPGIQPSSSQISTARTATGGNVYRSALSQERPMPTKQNLTEKIIQTDELNVKDAPGLEIPSNVSVQRSALFQERPMPTRQNLTEKIIQTDELNVKDAPGLEIPSNVSVQPGDNSSQLIQKIYTPDNMEEEDFRDPTSTYENFSDDEYRDAYDFSETTKQEVLIDIDNAKNKKNKIQNNNGNELEAVINGKNLTKDEYFDGGPSQQTDGTETNVTDVKSQTTVDQALQTLTDIIEKLKNKAVDTIKGPPTAVVNFLKEKENRDYIIEILRETNKFTYEIINEGFNFFDNFIKRTQKTVDVVTDATEETGLRIISTGINFGGHTVQGTNFILKSAYDVADTVVDRSANLVDKGVKGVSRITGTAVEESANVINKGAEGVSQITGTAVKGSANVLNIGAEGASQIADTVARGAGNLVNVSAQQGANILATTAKGFISAGPLMIKATTDNLKVAIEELTDTGVVAINNIDDFLDRAKITPRVRATAELMNRAANEAGEFLVSRLNIPKADVQEALEEMLVYGLDIGVKMSAAAGMAIYNIRQGLTMPVGPPSSSALIPSAGPENETRRPFTFNIQPPTGNINQSLVPTDENENRLKIVQQRLPALPAVPQQFPSQQLVPQTQNLSEEERYQQAKELTEKKLTNLKDIMESLTGNKGPVTRSNEVLTPVMFNVFYNGDYYQEILLETYRRYKKNERRSALKESYDKLWNDLKEDEQYLKTLGIAPVGSYREPFEFEWSKKGIESQRDKLENMRKDYAQVIKQFAEQREREREKEEFKRETKKASYSSYFSWWTSHN